MFNKSLARHGLYAVMVALPLLFAGSSHAEEREIREAICEPADLGVSADKISLQCGNAIFDGTEILRVFILPVTDAPFAERILTTVNAALTRRRLLVVQYQAKAPFAAPPSPGCPIAECRLIVAISIR